MTYYRVKSQYDNLCSGLSHVLIGDELYTPREFAELSLSPEWVEKVEISKSRIYRMFGARFEIKEKAK